MDRERFDALTRLFATRGSRRIALTTLLGAAVLGHDFDDAGTKGNGKGKGRGKGGGRGHDRRRGKGRDKNKGKGKNKHRVKNQAKNNAAAATSCCGVKSCPAPAPNSDRSNCNLAGQNLSGNNAQGSNLTKIDGRGTTFSTAATPTNWSRVNFAGSCLQGASFVNAYLLQGANFQGTCLIDADLTGARIDASTNFVDAVLCRTKAPAGSGLNPDRDCNRGTPCCATCDAQHPCPEGKLCCDGNCVSGVCCVKEDCPDQTCKNKACPGTRQCRYTNQPNNQPGTGCTALCCDGVCCEASERCVNGVCRRCNDVTCPNGCCDANDVCQPSADGACGLNGAPCRNCTTTPAAPVCVNGQCACPGPRVICTSVCCAAGQVCDTRPTPNVCCTADSDNVTCGVGAANPKCGNVTNNCGKEVNCGGCSGGLTCVNNTCVCNRTSCPQGCCDTATGPCFAPPTNQNCGNNGAICQDCTTTAAAPICSAGGQCVCPAPRVVCNGTCCAQGQVCNTAPTPNACCNPPSDSVTCGVGTANPKCGNVTNSCGQTVNCGECAPVTCRVVTCASNTCQVTGAEPDKTACTTAAGAAGICCGGNCVTAACCTNTDCTGGRVCTNGACTGPVCDVCPSGCTYTTLAAAVAGTAAGGTIRICPGTYPTNSVVIANNLTVVGAGSGSDPAIDTILTGGNTNRVLTILQSTVTIQDLTVTGGKGNNRSGGIEVVINATLTLERVEVVGNTADITPTGGNAGGGLGVFAGSTAVVKASRFANNSTQGGGSAVGGGIFNGGTLTLEATRVETNSARGGGGVFNSGRLTLNQGAVITMNTATEPAPSGGGIYNKGTIVDNDAGSNVFGNTPDNCISEAPGTGCPA